MVPTVLAVASRQLAQRALWRATSCALRAHARGCATSAPPSSLAVAFFGTDDVSLDSLRALHESLRGEGPHPGLVRRLKVVCPGDRPAGRGQHATAMPVAAYARQHGLRTLSVPYGLRKLREWDATSLEGTDVGAVVSFGYFLTPNVLAPLRRGALNMHPSLLPKYRGSAPIPRALLAGDTHTGVSIIDIHAARFDAGRVLDQVEVPINKDEGCAALTTRLAALGAGRLLHVLAHHYALSATASVQDEAGVTRAPKLSPAEGRLRWRDPRACTSERVLLVARAFDDAFGVYSHFTFGRPVGAPKRVRLEGLERVGVEEAEELLAALPSPAPPLPPPGALHFDRRRGRLLVRCADGWLSVTRLHVEFKPKAVTGAEFGNGHRLVHWAAAPPEQALVDVGDDGVAPSGGSGVGGAEKPRTERVQPAAAAGG